MQSEFSVERADALKRGYQNGKIKTSWNKVIQKNKNNEYGKLNRPIKKININKLMFLTFVNRDRKI